MKQQKSKRIEIEFRARFDKNKYKALEKFFKANAKDLGKDDKDVFFFILPDKLFKVVDNVSQKTAKIVLKLNKIGHGSDFEEIEIPINPSEVAKAVKMIRSLNLGGDLMESFQERHNYFYKGVEMALKYSDHWGYHLELEIMVNEVAKKSKAEQKIRAVAQELNVSLMNEKELQDFTRKVEKDYKRTGRCCF
ncbi:CYTH domain-containing protein [Patescibacteria group bacterium]|nr:CYTH domain-containing protein [Patescibacteria group bacterium]